MDIKHIGFRIAEIRMLRKFSTEQLANLVSVDEQTVLNWESGKEYPDTLILPALASALEVSIDYLLLGNQITQQKLFVGKPDNSYAYGRLQRMGITDKVNQEYLSKGWRIVETKMQMNDDNEVSVLVVVEK